MLNTDEQMKSSRDLKIFEIYMVCVHDFTHINTLITELNKEICSFSAPYLGQYDQFGNSTNKKCFSEIFSCC